jgi:hypothetical protein
MSTDAKPGTIEGGCLCGGVRYKITLPPNHDFSKGVCLPITRPSRRPNYH